MRMVILCVIFFYLIHLWLHLMLLYCDCFYGILSEKFLVSNIVTVFYIDCGECIEMTIHITDKVPCFRAGASAVGKQEQLGFISGQRNHQKVQRFWL